MNSDSGEMLIDSYGAGGPQKIVEAEPYNQQERLKLIEFYGTGGRSFDLYQSWIEYTKLFHLTDAQIESFVSSASGGAAEDGDSQLDKIERCETCFSILLEHQPSFKVYELYLEFIINNTPHELLDQYFVQETFIKNIEYHFEKSHIIWDRIVSYLEENHNTEQEQLIFIKSLYHGRFQIPHKTIETTISNFSSFVSKYFNDNYTSEMSKASKVYEKTKNDQWEIESLELKKSGYENQSDFWIDNLNFWSSKPKKQRSLKPIKAVFQRAADESTDPSYIKVWIRFFLILFENGALEDEIVTYSKRFIRAFPSSPLSYAELFKNIQSDQKFSDLYQSNLNRLLWLGILKNDNYEEWSSLASSILVYELKSVLKSEMHLAEQLLDHLDQFFKHALENCQDVYHRVERLCVFVAEAVDEIDISRDFLKSVTGKFGSEAENWLISHNFEKKHGDPKSASKILLAAINRATTLDWPERIFEEALLYEKVHGDVNSYNSLLVRIDKKSKEVQQVREQAVIGAENLQAGNIADMNENSAKRKADDDDDDDDAMDIDDNKKQRTEFHRDREHLTISVKNIPLNINEKQVLNFFKGCGEVSHITIVENEGFLHAKLEFLNEESLLKALTKDHKRFHGSELKVEKAYKTVVWVTNFPPSSTKEDIDALFSPIGKLSGIRFPSLKFNSQRRFCYVEFLESKDALKAVEQLSGADKDGYKLVVKISDPESKTARKGAVEEGREVYVAKLDFYRATSEKVKELFSKYGTVERVHLPRSEQSRAQNKKHDGYGFVTFATPEEAHASLELNLVTFEGRVIEVSISKKKSEREQTKETSAFDKHKNSENSIALLGVPDTINAAQITTICSEAGEVENVYLEPEHQGAIVLFKDPRDAGKASLQLNGRNTGLAGYIVKVGTVHELKSHQATIKDTHSARKPMMPSSLRRKPKVVNANQAQAPAASNLDTQPVEPREQESKTTARSNDDFRALFLAGKK